MKLSTLAAACLVIPLAGAAAAALLAMPSGCSAQDVVVARAELGVEAGDVSATADGGDSGSNCSKDRSGRWWCPDSGAAAPACADDGGGGPFCFAGADAHVWNPPAEASAGQPCSNNDDCPLPGTEFCAKPSCGAEMGECQLRPVACDDVPDDAGTVCGCDGVDYWNECLRMRDGVSSSMKEQCSSEFVTCGGPEETPCPVPDAFCFIQATEQCNGATGGTCWVLPDGVCSDAGPHNWQTCGNSTTPPCVNLCEAIQSREPHMRAGAACP